MAIYHLSVKIVSRSKGRSAVAASAYRAGEKVADHSTGLLHDYSRKSDVDHHQLINAAGHTRESLWNTAEQAEKRKNSNVAREYQFALPVELSREAQIEAAQTMAGFIVEQYGVAADLCLHNLKGNNPHAHLLTTTRVIDQEGHLNEKTRILDGKRTGSDQIHIIREKWAEIANQALTREGHDAEIDHRTLEAQGIDREPTIHLGPNVIQMEKRGIKTEKGQKQAGIKARNKERRQIDAEILDFEAACQRLRSTSFLSNKEALKRWNQLVEQGCSVNQAGFDHEQAKINHRKAVQSERHQAHQAARPVEPTGVMALFRKKAYEKDLSNWAFKNERFEEEHTRLCVQEVRLESSLKAQNSQVEADLSQRYPSLAKQVASIRAKEKREERHTPEPENLRLKPENTSTLENVEVKKHSGKEESPFVDVEKKEQLLRALRVRRARSRSKNRGQGR